MGEFLMKDETAIHYASNQNNNRISTSESEQLDLFSGEQEGSRQVKPLATFQVITDTHVTEEPQHIHNLHLERALTDLLSFSEGSSGIMHIGDVTDHGRLGEYHELHRILKSYRTILPPIRYTLGNHDVGIGLVDEPPAHLLSMSSQEIHTWVQEAMAKSAKVPMQEEKLGDFWEQRLGMFMEATDSQAPYHDHWIDGYHFIFLGTEQPHPKDCEMSSTQLQWLETTLAEQAAPNRPIFVFLHQPLLNTVAGSIEEQGWYGVKQDTELKAVLNRYPQVMLFTGHTHWTLDNERTRYGDDQQRPSMFNAASVAYLWTDEDEYLEGSQGLHVEIYEDRVIVRGRDFVQGCWLEGVEYTVNYPVSREVEPSL